MKKHYFAKTTMLFLISLMGVITIRGQIVYELQESFESGTIPEKWSQEYKIGNTAWTVEKDGNYPNGAIEGSWRAVLRNTTQQTQGFITRLISPPLNLSDVYQPVLIFSHAQDHNLGDVDELRVLYRISENDTWVQLEEYKDRIRNWQMDTIRLIGDTYQIAFEGTDKYGRGIVLDNIEVRPMPTCTQPAIQGVSEATSNFFNLFWRGSFDADSFAVRVSKTRLDDVELAENLVLDTVVIESFACPVRNLTVNTTYYCYVKSYCQGEETSWSNPYSHKTQAVITIPHKEDFNLPLKSGYLDRVNTWTWKCSWNEPKNYYCPHVNTQTTLSDLGYYSRDISTCVVFSGDHGVKTPIPADQWAYIASPEIIEDDLSTAQTSFWATAYNFVEDAYASSLIVGIMTDPEDISTFKAMDTVTIDTYRSFEEFIIPFDKYDGKGKYVAFLSQFDKNNIIYIDEVRIDPIPVCQKISKVRAKNILARSAQVTWINAVTASAYNVLVTSESVKDPSQAASEKIVYQTQVTTNLCQLPDNTLQPITDYYVYVQAVCGGNSGEWSNEYIFQTACEPTLPMYFTFEPDIDGAYPIKGTTLLSNCLYSKSGYPSPPNNTKSYAQWFTYEGEYCLQMLGYPDSKAYVVFPPVSDVSKIRISFMGITNDSYVGKGSTIEVGVMSDMNDYATFKSLETIVIQGGFNPYVVDFSDYKGNDKNIAIIVSPKNQAGEIAYAYLDNLLIEEIDENCTYPLEPTVIPGETSAEFNWKSSGVGSSYRLIVSDVSLHDSLLGKTKREIDSILKVNVSLTDTLINTTSCKVENLKTDNTTYYYYLRTVCGQDFSSWTLKRSFETLCFSKNILPYEENFEAYTGGSSVTEIPLCWNTVFARYTHQYGTNYYPYISLHSDNSAYSGTKTLYLGSQISNPVRADYVVLPGMNVESVVELQASFMLKLSSLDYILEVGVISDITDTTTFVPVKTYRATNDTKGKWQEIVATFENYKGDGKNIMFRSPAGMLNGIYIDDLKIDSLKSCLKPQNLKASDITSNSAKLYWDNGLHETEWNLMVLNKKDVAPSKAASSDIVFNEVVTTNPFLLDENLQQNIEYYYYLQSICGDDTTDWTLNCGSFRTGCIPKTIEIMGVETFEEGDTDFDCWERGMLTGTTNAPNITSNNNSKRLRIYNTTSSDGAYAIMPEIDIDSIKKLQVSFDMYTTSSSVNNPKSIIVGVITNSNDLFSFIAIDTVRAEVVNDFNQKFTVRFNRYKGDYRGQYGKKIMFLSSFGLETTANDVYLDNISFNTISSCPEPTKVWADSIGTYGARLEWNGDKSSKYRTVVSKISLTPDQLNSALNEDDIVLDRLVEGIEVDVPELSMLTRYFVYVQNICSETEKGHWSNEYYFTTQCPVSYPLPYVENFDNYGTGTGVNPWCWSVHYGAEGSVSVNPNYPNCNASYDNSYRGKASLYVYTAATTGYYCMTISPRLDLDDISRYQIYFDVLQASAITEYPKMIVGLTDDPTNFNLDSYLPIDTVCIPVDQVNPERYEWYKYKYDLSYLSGNPSAPFYKYLVFTVIRDLNRANATATTGTGGGLYLDNVEIELIPGCQKPDNFHYEKLTHQSFTAAWNDSVAVSWSVQYGESGYNLGEGTIISSNTQSALVDGLQPDTEYDVYVKADCESDGGESEWLGPMLVRTRCFVDPGASFGFEENEGYYYSVYSTSNKLPLCWTVGHSTPISSSIPYNMKNTTSAIYSRTDDYGLRMFVSATYPGYAYAIMPEIDANYDTLQVSFSARAIVTKPDGAISSNYTTEYLNPHIIVGTVTDPTDFTTFEEIIKIDLSRWQATDSAKLENNFLWDDLVVPLYGVKDKFITFAASYKDANEGTYYMYLDDISVERESVCSSAYDVSFENYGNDITAADLTWKVMGSLHTEWNVNVLKEKIDIDTLAKVDPSLIIYSGTVTDPSVLNITIEPSGNYYAYIKTTCNNGESEWTLTEITTPCSYVELPAEWTFSESGGQRTGVNEFYSPECWNVGIKVRNKPLNQNYIPYKIPDTGSLIYSRSEGGEHAFMLYSYLSSSSGNFDGTYAIMPGFIGDMDTLQLHFHGRAVHTNATLTPKGYKVTANYATTSYPRSVIVGTTTKHDDISTFVPLDTVTFSIRTTNDYASEENNWLYDEIVVPLTGATGNYVAFLSQFGKSNRIYLDDVRIEKLGGCYPPQNLKIDAISSTTANLTWELNQGGNDGIKWAIHVAKDAEMKNVVSKDTIKTYASFPIGKLSPGTKYYVSVKQFCEEEEESEWSEIIEFTTSHILVFDETFAAGIHCPVGWSRYNYLFNKDVVYTKDMSAHNPTGSTSGWARTSDGYGLPAAHQKVTVQSTGTKYWFMTPSIELPQENTWLAFDLALTTYNSPHPIAGDDLTGNDERFAVVISDDGGISWKTNNKTEWNNKGTGNYIYNNIPATGQKVFIDLSEYAGKVIKVGFYAESTVENAKTDIHIDNVHINRFIKVNHQDTECSGHDYAGYGFDIMYNDVKVGENSFTRSRLSANSSIVDSLVSLSLTVTPLKEIYLNGRTCEGEVYNDDGFSAKEEGIYKRKLSCTTTGCDSVAILNLSVIKAIRKPVSETICQGKSYIMNGKEYKRTGIYTDTLQSLVTGCDSIVTLQLKVNDMLREEINEVICYGKTYLFKGEELTKTGVYRDTTQTALGCDSVITLNLIAKPKLETYFDAVTCPGQPYTGHGFDRVPPITKVYYRTEITEEGTCDSTIYLRLTVLDNDTSWVSETIYQSKLPYTYQGKYYDENTPPGVYRDTTSVSSGEECEGVLVATLTIEKDPTGLLSNVIYQLSIIPTIIEKGESVQIIFDNNGTTEVAIEVYDMTGKFLYKKQSTVDPIEINAFPNTGMYLIKAITSQGDIKYGRVIVK